MAVHEPGDAGEAQATTHPRRVLGLVIAAILLLGTGVMLQMNDLVMSGHFDGDSIASENLEVKPILGAPSTAAEIPSSNGSSSLPLRKSWSEFASPDLQLVWSADFDECQGDTNDWHALIRLFGDSARTSAHLDTRCRNRHLILGPAQRSVVDGATTLGPLEATLEHADVFEVRARVPTVGHSFISLRGEHTDLHIIDCQAGVVSGVLRMAELDPEWPIRFHTWRLDAAGITVDSRSLVSTARVVGQSPLKLDIDFDCTAAASGLDLPDAPRFEIDYIRAFRRKPRSSGRVINASRRKP